MDIRTTVHNTAVQAQRERAAEHGVYTFQITSHPGARPLCAPYQGYIYSWDGSSGYVYDIDGQEYWYDSIYNTSYGEPAGIFGINCGHDPETFVDGYSKPRYEPTTDMEENDRLYKLTQQQRALERNVRYAKTEAAAMQAAGYEEGFQRAAQQVKRAEDKLNSFVKENNLTKRVYNTQVSAYNKGVSAAVNAAANKAAKVLSEKENYLKYIRPTLLKTNAPATDRALASGLYVSSQVRKGPYINGGVPTGATISNVRIMAGYGTQTSMRNASKYAEAYGGESYKWQKLGGVVTSENYRYDIHWYEYAGSSSQYDVKLKGVYLP